jgi:glycosyltransferase involved in cell wall biosynthesis
MSKIVIDARELRTSTGRYVERLLHYLQQIDKNNSYLVLLKPKDIESWIPTNKKFTKVECPYKEFSWSEQIDLWRQVKKLKADLVHFTIVQQPIFYRGKVVTTMHDLTTTRYRNPTKNWLIFTFRRWVYRLVNKIVARKSSVVITPSQYVKDDVARFAKINSRKIMVTYEAADKITDEPLAIEELVGQKFIMYVGRSQPHKNLDRLVQAFDMILKEHPDLYLVLAGKRDLLYRKLALKVKAKGITNVTFTGFIEDAKLRWLYENAAAYVFPSLSEGFGLPGLEAMVHGCPVVSSNATCLPEIYGEAAEYFDPLNINDMAGAIDRVLKNEATRSKLIKWGRAQAAKYSWEHTARQTLEIYKKVLNDEPLV